ncbi:hypothetical protein [Actinomadura sp. DC4]|uniref:hypothetical protein n=1 Tax=Actinomadura sp. DC4 TaxID=3055069 RepID=UPI0025B1887D|nr:hypothetical protein [Actinomadura sp. DC4]MDN3357066.1 hypothetical protein [Actinomadura sp. DC4]
MRFAVRRPATRPVTSRGHRPPGGDAVALPAGSSAWLDGLAAPEAAVTDPAMTVRPRSGGTPIQNRRSLARVLLSPAGLGADSSAGQAGVTAGRPTTRVLPGSVEATSVPPGWLGARDTAPASFGGAERVWGAGVSAAARRESAGVSPGPAEVTPASRGTVTPVGPAYATSEASAWSDDAGQAGDAAPVSTCAGSVGGLPVPEAYGAASALPEALGATTDRLLLGHLRGGRRAGSSRRPLDASPTVTEIAGRERRTPPGAQARALTSRGR